jgi:hypothetical protein
MRENWADVVGYEGLYLVSDQGRVYSKIKNRIRKQCLNKANGYMMLFLVDLKGGKKCVYVHRLVAMAFIKREPGKDIVNHKDENKTNNCANNIEWCTKHYNNTYNGKIEVCEKPVLQLSRDGKLIKKWKSAREAARSLRLEYKNISACCYGKRNVCGEFVWKFAKKEEVA